MKTKKINLGRVGLVPKGAYSPDATYGRMHLVTYKNTTYWSKQEGNTGHEPLGEDDWWGILVDGQAAYAGAFNANEAAKRAYTAAKEAELTNAVVDAAEQMRESAETERNKAEEQRKAQAQSNAEAEQARAKAEQSRVEAESQRVEAEERRASEETLRAAAEDTRKSDEADRIDGETSREQQEDSRVAAEQTRDADEAQRKIDETKRADEEAKRVDAEDARKEAETGRASAETDRAAAETARVKAETARAKAETARADAESKRETDFSAKVKEVDTAVTNAKTATSEAEKVDATITDDNVFEVTGRDGVKKSLELVGQAEAATIKTELAGKFDKANVVQELGEAEDKVMSQKVVSEKINDMFFNKLNSNSNTESVIKDNSDAFYFADSQGNVIAKIDKDGLQAIRFFDGKRRELKVSDYKAKDGNIPVFKSNQIVESPINAHVLYGKKIYVMGTSNDYGWPQMLADKTGAIFDSEKHKYITEGGTFAGDIGDELYPEENKYHRDGGSVRAKNFCLLSDSDYGNEDYLFMMTQNNPIVELDLKKFSFFGSAREGIITVHIEDASYSYAVKNGEDLSVIAKNIERLNSFNSVTHRKKYRWSAIAEGNNLVMHLNYDNNGDANDTIYIDFGNTGINAILTTITAEDNIRYHVYHDDPIMFSQFIRVDTNTYNGSDCVSYYNQHFNEIIEKFNEPKPFSFIHLLYHSYSRVFTITSGCNKTGELQFSLNGTKYNVEVTQGMGISEVINKISSDITEYFPPLGWQLSAGTNTISFAIINSNASESDVFSFIDNGTGVIVDDINGIVSDTLIEAPYMFNSRDISLWNDQQYWKSQHGYVNPTSFMKGNIEYIQKNKPYTKIVIYAGPSYSMNPEIKRADGTWDVETFVNTNSIQAGNRYKGMFCKYLADFYGLQYIDCMHLNVMTNWQEFYPANNVHYNNKLKERIAETIARNVY